MHSVEDSLLCLVGETDWNMFTLFWLKLKTHPFLTSSIWKSDDGYQSEKRNNLSKPVESGGDDFLGRDVKEEERNNFSLRSELLVHEIEVGINGKERPSEVGNMAI